MWGTTAFLPPEFRAMMGYEWTEKDEAKFDRMMRRYGRIDHKLPDIIRLFPFNLSQSPSSPPGITRRASPERLLRTSPAAP